MFGTREFWTEIAFADIELVTGHTWLAAAIEAWKVSGAYGLKSPHLRLSTF